jgi:signal transduction histidine kinase
MPILFGKVLKMTIISISLVVIISFSLLFYINEITEKDIRDSIFNQNKLRQIDSTKNVSKHIGSDLNLVMSMLDGLTNSVYMQQGNQQSDSAKKLLEEKYSQFHTIINRLFVLDKNGIVTMSLAPIGAESFLSSDLSRRDWVETTKSSLQPTFSSGFERQGVYRIFITDPIINRSNGKYLGMIVASIPTQSFFSNYGNVEHIGSQFLVVYDGNGTMLANGASKSFIGQNFFNNYTQHFINSNKILNNLTRSLLDGKGGEAVYNYGNGERLTTQSPIIVQGIPRYFVQVVQPTTEIYSQISTVLFSERVKMFLLFTSTIAAVGILTIFLAKWNRTLDSEIRRRTAALNESNSQLKLANNKLKEQQKLQREFIDIAAHELRTPIQPIIGLSNIIGSKLKDSELLKMQAVVIRNANRLSRLTGDLLDVARIESKNLRLRKERFNLNENIKNVVDDIKSEFPHTGEIQLTFEPSSPAFIYGDKERIYQVIINLVRNAFKFTKQGIISIQVDIKRDQTIVSIKDSGQGLAPEVLPKLFSKFATTSPTGTGLGLFISKAIIEAHGGRLWAENNNDNCNGATFLFSIPTNDQPKSTNVYQDIQAQSTKAENTENDTNHRIKE